MYLKNPAVVSLVHPEAFDGHWRPRRFTLAHVCECTTVANLPKLYFPLKNIPCGYDGSGFTDLGKQQQTPLTVFVTERRPLEDLCPTHSVVRFGDEAHIPLTRSRKFINICASFPWRLLTASTLDGQLKKDWTSERHSDEVASIE